ncbi:tRNA pseudouridine(13) synthase TruD [soil metagenome]
MQEFSYHLRTKDEAKLREIGLTQPELLRPTREMDFSPATSELVGITHVPQTAGKGHIKFTFEDFIVEEITETGELCTIAPPKAYQAHPYNPETQKIEATVTKKGMNGFELSERFAEALNIPLKFITYGGLKDGRGVTSQRYSFNATPPERLAGVQIPNTFIKDIHPRTGMRNTGELRGNRFTITLRTSPDTNPYLFHARLQDTERNGFLNFFSLQRFGSRLNAHHLGKLVLQQQYQEAVKRFLTEASPFESELSAQYRAKAATSWGDWDHMIEAFSPFPYFFQNELSILKALRDNATNPALALASIPQQVKMWVAAYESYAFNLLLSLRASQGDVPEKLPQLHPDMEVKQQYAAVIPEAELATFRWYHPQLLFLGSAKRRETATRSFPTMHVCQQMQGGYILRFELGKGAYATNFLTNLVLLSQGRFAPDWVNPEHIDATALLDGYAVSSTLQALTPAPPLAPESLED